MKNKKDFDFVGWATKFDIKCADGRTIRHGAFSDNVGKLGRVPLVWNHAHGGPENVVGYADLEHNDEGVRAYGSFNDTEKGKTAKLLVEHGDITSLSIYANHLTQRGGDVLHGLIREVSLVLAGANPGASIDYINFAHSDSEDSDAIIWNDDQTFLFHSDEEEEEKQEEPEESEESKDESEPEEEKEDEKEEPEEPKEIEHSEGEKEMADKTVQEVIDGMSEEQKQVMYAMVGAALEEKEKGDENMAHNLFENEVEEDVLSHDDMMEILNDAEQYGSLKKSALQHGITNVSYLFPDAKNVTNTPQFIQRDQEWVADVMANVHHTPFSRIKSIFADLTPDAARAKGYVKGTLKIDQVLGLLKRETTPTTVYKKQSMDRDDVIDITDFDVVAWLKSEMRVMLNEELARAFLIGDGRTAGENDKINENCIRPIWTDSDLYTIKEAVEVASNATDDQIAKAFIRHCIMCRKDYKGSGNPTLYTTEDVLTKCLLMEDQMGRVIYDTEEKLRTALRVKKIVTVPVMENQSRTDDDNNEVELMGILVNLADYNVGADKGGAVSLFDDFDIDYNKQKYLIETRCSGALIKPYSAVALELSFQ